MGEELELRSLFLGECLGRLSPREQELLRLRYHEGLQPSTLAPRLRLSPGAVRVALTRIRQALRTCIEAKLSLPAA